MRKSSRFHKRCGTSFLLIVMISQHFVFYVYPRGFSRSSVWYLRLLLIPVIAGVSYEFIRLAGRSDNAVVNLLSKPGLMAAGFDNKGTG
ncbi:MAG: DUF1385 domain-containing protein [Roseburia intestinalis]